MRKNVEPEVDYYRSKNRLDSFRCIETNHDAVGLREHVSGYRLGLLLLTILDAMVSQLDD